MAHVLITGGAGFIGSRVAARLVSEGHRVRVLDALISQVHGPDPETTSPLLRAVSDVAEVQRGTVTSLDDLRAALVDVDTVIHLAAETGTGQSMYEIDRYVEANIGGTAKLMDLLTNEPHGVRRVVVASSRSVYGEGAYRSANGTVVYPPHRSDTAMAEGDFAVRGASGEELELIPTTEDAVLHPSSVYGITKQVQESLVMTVAPTIGVEPVSLRYQNVFGPGQSLTNPYTGILSIFSTLIRQGKGIDVFEDGQESRDFVYIDDVVEATVLAALEPAAAGGVFNVGSGAATTVLEVVDALVTAFGAQVEVTVSGRYRLGDIRHNVADTSRLRDVLGFEPSVPFVEGVRRFVEWVADEPIGGGEYERSLDEMAARRLLK
ncbi:NAD-dependent epimerase/dehydratase family protein [Microbacterium enclense]|uniref:dTDP-L-rhamnose 4-epimerase n=1 Tax=Microbacterium enclense TaxID=993073 RepID=A0A1G6K7U6_9MICO|nr:NAD-dependent epimerase/dehydratase family protein [Microbacterium enclense]KSU54062.1 epimerase [Microbacterium enclense]MCM3613793.1 NAD-dependent epimerase/dehydratase family protein [Microbacterium enclense]SDC27080.1 dTDP-L-rhamnose 4-epimerase [Microbacterium enclense]